MFHTKKIILYKGMQNHYEHKSLLIQHLHKSMQNHKHNRCNLSLIVHISMTSILAQLIAKLII